MKFLALILTTLFMTTAFAATPYPPEINKRFKTLEALPSNVGYTTNGITNLRIARFAFDSATMGTSAATAYSMGATLPAKSILWDGMIYVTSTFTSAGSVAVHCEDYQNILATKLASSFGATGASVALVETGTAASARAAIASACVISASVTGSNVVGKFNGWLLYFTAD